MKRQSYVRIFKQRISSDIFLVVTLVLVTTLFWQQQHVQAAINHIANAGGHALALFASWVPTGDPGAGFDIEGDLNANTPTPDTTDWTPGASGAGVAVLDAAGVPVDPAKTTHVTDLYDSPSDNVFTGGSKVHDDPNVVWHWTLGKPNAKDDINHGLLHYSMDANNHLWVVLGGDRLSNNGNSHLSFEFLQKTLVKNADGTFTSAGTQGGRTVGDLLVHIDFNQGGGAPTFSIDRWQAVGAGYDFVMVTPPAGSSFVAANTFGVTPVSFGAFGQPNYQQNQFGEAALDISGLIQGFDPCLGVRTVFIKTAASASPMAVLQDFIDPIQAQFGTVPFANAGPDQSACQVGADPVIFNLDGTATNGTSQWSIAGTTGTATAEISDVNVVNPTVKVTGLGTVTLQLTVMGTQCGSASDQMVLTVTAGAQAEAGTDQTLCQATSGPTIFALNGAVTEGAMVDWQVISSTGGATATIDHPANAATNVNVTGTGTVTLQLTAMTTRCGSALDTVVLTVNPEPSANAGTYAAQCLTIGAPASFNLNGTVANGTPQWSVFSQDPTITSVNIATPNSAATSVTIGGTGNVVLALTATSNITPSCGTATSFTTLTVNPLPNVTAGLGKVLTCVATTVVLEGASTTPGAQFSWSGPGGFTSILPQPSVSVPGTYTLTVTDPATSCVASESVVITQNITTPDVNAGTDKELTCATTSVVLNGASATSGALFSWTGPGGFASALAQPTVTAPGTYTLTVTDPVNGCTASDSAVVTQNATPPNVSAGPDQLLTCAVTAVTLNGSSATPGVSYHWTGPGGFTSPLPTPTVNVPGTYTLTVTDPSNGCAASDVAEVLQNITPPNVNAGPDQLLTCATTAVVLNGSSLTPGAMFSWSGPGGFTSNLATPTVNVPGVYTLTVTDPANGCTASDQANVLQNITPPDANAGPDKVLTCAVTSVVLNGSSPTNGALFHWTGPGGFTSNLAMPSVTQPGVYTLTVTDPVNGCTASDTALVTQNLATPNVEAGPDKMLTCATTAVVLNGVSTTPDALFSWSGPGGFTSNLATPTVMVPGIYTLTVTNPVNGCTAIDTATVAQDLSQPDATITAPATVIANSTGHSASVPDAGAGASYVWTITNGTITSGQGTRAIIFSGGSVGQLTLNVTVANDHGCSASGAALVTVFCPVITVNPATLPNPVAGVFYNQTVSATGGNGTLSFSVSAGALPAGLSLNGASGAITGTPTTIGPFSFTIQVTDGFGCVGTRQYQGNTGCPTITVPSPPAVTAGTPYSFQFTATPAGGGYSFAVTSGALPTGLTLTPGGLLSGTTMVAGPYTFTVTATGFGGQCSGSVLVDTNFVTCPTLTLSPASLPNGTAGTAYNQTITANPAGGSYNYAVSYGALPPGLALDANTGALTGTPLTPGTYYFTIRATGFGICAVAQPYTVAINCPTITISPDTLPYGQIGVLYSQPLTATPAGNYVWSVAAGALPAGLSLNPNTGLISGTPLFNGTSNFSIRVTGFDTCATTRSLTIEVGCPAITFSPTALPDGIAGQYYTPVQITTNPPGVYTFSLQLGQLPPGYILNLNNTPGLIGGASNFPGLYTFTLKLTGTNNCIYTTQYSIRIVCPTITVNPATLPNGTAGTFYSQTITGDPPTQPGVLYSFAVLSGALPPGLTLNSSTGVLSGTPSAIGTYSFVVQATGFTNCTGTRSYTVTIGGECPTITPPALPATGRIGTYYLGDLSGTEPFGSYSFTLTAGALPPGLVLDSVFNAVAGMPTTNGRYNFTLKAADKQGCAGTRNYTITIGMVEPELAMQADYDGDGVADQVLWSAGSGEWHLNLSGRQQAQTVNWGMAGDVPLLGDYDGDGKTDVAVWRPSAATWFVKGSGGAVLLKQLGVSTDVPVPGDYDGDGKTDFAVWRGANGTWQILRSSDGMLDTVAWGTSAAPYNDVAVPGDYDGDGKTDLAVFRRFNGMWLVKRSSDSQIITKAFGISTDVPVPGDYDGDGKTDFAVWRASIWYVWQSANNAARVVEWGANFAPYLDQAAPSDYDGDGQVDVAIWRASTQTWFIRCSADGSVLTRVQGQANDVTVTASHNH